MKRSAELTRNTSETQISLSLALDGRGEAAITTDCGFLKHMLELFAKHGRFDIALVVSGDSEVDFHHTVEDVGIALGAAFKSALGDCRGICRYGTATLPMDEAVIDVALDISNRPYYQSDLKFETARVGSFDTELVDEFFAALARSMGLTLHIFERRGKNSHHVAEAAFKGVARALRQAVKLDAEFKDDIPSTKGVI